MAEQQKFEVDVDVSYTDAERRELAREIIDFIVSRTRDKNLDKDNRSFPGYSKDYINSLEFKLAGKSRSDIDLTLSGDMLDSIKLLSSRAGKLVIGFDRGTENDKAEGNRIGSYGKSFGNPTKARDFLGIHPEDLSKILEANPPSANILDVEREVIDRTLERLNIVQSFGFNEDS